MSKSETVHVKFLRSHPAYGYFAGDTAEISKDAYDEYSQDGPFFELVKGKAVAAPAEGAPADPPAPTPAVAPVVSAATTQKTAVKSKAKSTGSKAADKPAAE